MSPLGVGNLLHRLGLTPQKPLRRAYEREEKAVQEWLEKVYPKVKEIAKKTIATIFWLDEALLHSDVPLQRKWGARRKMPVVKTNVQRQSINAIPALSNKGGFGILFITENLRLINALSALNDFLKNRKSPVKFIVNGHPVHKFKK